MEIFWYIVLVFMLIAFIILDGFDFGAGMVHLFFAKEEKDKQAIVKSIGPFWDANEVWLIAAGGVMFFAFPTLYASAFSGFYLPLMLILWLLIFRAIGLELRNQFKNSLWQNVWDKAFGISSMLLALFFGVALANCMRGVNFGDVTDSTSLLEGHYFFLPFWSSSFNPFNGNDLGAIDAFTLLFGIKGALVLFMHGSNWIIFKTNSSLNTRLKALVPNVNALIGLTAFSSLYFYIQIHPSAFDNFTQHPWMLIFPVGLLSCWIMLFRAKHFQKDSTGFLFSSALIFFGISTVVSTLFPNFIRSSNAIHPALDAFNTSTEEYGLNIGLQWFIIGALLVAIYFTMQFWLFRGKLDSADYGDH